MRLHFWLLITLSLISWVKATPPACFLSCLNEYAVLCPNAHRDIKCLYANSEVIINCFSSRCPSEHFLSARDHFLGVCLELLGNTTVGSLASDLPNPSATEVSAPIPTTPQKISFDKLNPSHKYYGEHKPYNLSTQNDQRFKSTSIKKDQESNQILTKPSLDSITGSSKLTALQFEPSLYNKDHQDFSLEPIATKKFEKVQEELSLRDQQQLQEGESLITTEFNNNQIDGELLEASSFKLALNNKQLENPTTPQIKRYGKLSRSDDAVIEESGEAYEEDDNSRLHESESDLYSDAGIKSLPNFSRKPPIYRMKKNLPNFSKKKLVNRLTTDEGLSNSKIKSKFAEKI